MANKKTELLLPAGSLETLKTAVDYGADAVYLGGGSYSLRAKADNFTPEEMKQGLEYAHGKGVKVYLTLNIYAHNADIEGVRKYLSELSENKFDFDAILVSDPGIFMLVKEILPDMEIHISTQANNTNYLTYNFWYGLGARRVVAARELSLEEIASIRKNIPEDMEIEAFMHGAMCISYSGRCLLSSYFTGRDANRGACTHPCRWKYSIVEEQRPGEYLPVEEDDRGTYIFNSKDLCMVEYIPEMIDAGIYSFKVEGRMKTALYVAASAKTYREALDDLEVSEELYRSRIPHYKDEISACTFRQFTTGFYFGKPDHESQVYDSNTYIKNYIYLGKAEELIKTGDEECLDIILFQKNKFSVGDLISVMPYKGDNAEAFVEAIYDEEGNEMENAPHPKQKLKVRLRFVKTEDVHRIEIGNILRMKSE